MTPTDPDDINKDLETANKALLLASGETKVQQTLQSTRPSWDQYFMIIAKVVALRSTCNSRPGGAIIVSPDNRILATGYTASVAGSFQCCDKGPDYCYRRSRNVKDSEKYNVCKSLHAEQNALLYAARYGVSVIGSRMYCTLQPCYICLKLIAGAGLSSVFFELLYESSNKERDDNWKEAFDELGVICKQVSIEQHNILKTAEFIQFPTSYRRLLSTE